MESKYIIVHVGAIISGGRIEGLRTEAYKIYELKDGAYHAAEDIGDNSPAILSEVQDRLKKVIGS